MQSLRTWAGIAALAAAAFAAPAHALILEGPLESQGNLSARRDLLPSPPGEEPRVRTNQSVIYQSIGYGSVLPPFTLDSLTLWFAGDWHGTIFIPPHDYNMRTLDSSQWLWSGRIEPTTPDLAPYTFTPNVVLEPSSNPEEFFNLFAIVADAPDEFGIRSFGVGLTEIPHAMFYMVCGHHVPPQFEDCQGSTGGGIAYHAEVTPISIPEPGSLALLAFAAGAGWVVRRKRTRQT